MGSQEHEELRRQLLETNISLALLEKTKNYLYDPQYRDLRSLKIKLIKLMKKLAVKEAMENQIKNKMEEGRRLWNILKKMKN